LPYTILNPYLGEEKGSDPILSGMNIAVPTTIGKKRQKSDLREFLDSLQG